MRIFGLLGYPLHHSRSKEYFNAKFREENLRNCLYENFQLENIADIQTLLSSNPDIEGLNVTIPHKTAVMTFLDDSDNAAKAIGAVNCLKISKNFEIIKIKGFNTDAEAFKQSLKPLLVNFHGKALILGSGGSAKAVSYVLNKMDIQHLFVSRSPKAKNEISYPEIDSQCIENHKLIINCTPAGTFPDIDTAPDLPFHLLDKEHILFDLVYNPEETLFLKKGKAQGASTKNGLEMLYLQAEASWKIWNSNEE